MQQLMSNILRSLPLTESIVTLLQVEKLKVCHMKYTNKQNNLAENLFFNK